MPIVTPTLNLPQPTVTASKPAVAPVPLLAAATAAPTPAATPAARPTEAPSATVSLSPQALSALAADTHAAPASPGAATPGPAAGAHDASVYESLKKGLSTAASDVGSALSRGAHAVVDGAETALSAVHTGAKAVVELPFAVVAKACDAAGALIDEL